ncbi:MAG: NAD(P)(+) transhydrogenase (Re/Si-specific) subunit alpha, partial [Candidatus Omnitrophica bacterium]|nr:NAD(P)(+) transhydrogenase (Re/Si-specific) subunit alpha [Candidatus Omnitrophota bacterium]
MQIGIPKEVFPNEKRAPIIPSSVERLAKKELKIAVENGLGASIGISDDEYQKAGAVVTGRDEILSSSDIVLRLRKPPVEEITKLKKGSFHISFLDPFNEAALVDAFAKENISAISMEMIPRST